MQSYFTFTSVFTLLCCLLTGCLYAWILYGKTGNLAKNTRNAVAVARTLAIALICWLLFSPLVKTVSYVLEKPVIIIANDNSISTGHITAKGFNAEAYKKDLTALAAKLGKSYDVHTYSFSDSVKNGLDFSGKGKFSNAAAFSERMADEFQNRNIGAVIIASDGIFNRGGNPVYELNKLRAPIYTIGLGDTIPKRDVLVANVNYNDLVYLDNDFSVEVQVQAYQSKNERTKITISEGGRSLYQQDIEINSGVFIKDVPVKLKAASPGIKKYTVNVSGLKNEITTRNNSFDFFVEVVDGKQDVLIAAASPHPDISALRQAIELNKHYKVTLALEEDLAALDLNKFGSVILYQLPAQQNLAASLFQKLQQSKASVWFILGAQTNLNSFNAIQRGVQLTGNSGNMQEVFPVQEKSFTPFSTDQGIEKYLQSFDPLMMPFGRLNINGRTTAFLNQRIGKIETAQPLFFFMEDNGRKIAYLMGEGIWRWKLNETQNEQQFSAVDDMIGKTIQYLSIKEDKRKFRAFSSKNTFDEQESIVINATLYNDSYAPVNSPDVSLKVRNEAGKVFNYTFTKTETAYRLDAGILPKGSYSFEAIVNYGGRMHIANGAFYVREVIAEYQQTTANHQLLRSMSVNGGKFYSPGRLLDIADALQKSDNLKTLSYEDKKYEDLINLKWLFAVIMILLSAEWFVRKRFGEL
ncbi:MAG: hypothetical protein EOP53_17210 [Sphingobacteriales bacterium]|nr:MAG: hypothetical protein EOP53_17210 [Sphingobacteriales bacterium]